MANPIPTPYIVLGLVLAVLAAISGAFLYGYDLGSEEVQERWDLAAAETAKDIAELRAKAAEVTTVEVVKYVDRVVEVQGKTKTIVKEVPVYVSKESDNACVVPDGFVRVHDAAAAGDLPEAPSDSDAAPSGVALSTVAATVAENYGTCTETRETLTALQSWATEICKIGKCQ